MKTSSCIAILVLGTAAVAQGPTLTSPFGLENREGNSSHWGHLFQAERRFQQIDDTLTAHGPAAITALSFRRDAARPAATATARDLSLTVVMAHSVWASIATSFSGNYRGPATTAFATRTVNLPDWSAPRPGPAPFDFTIPLDAPFAYDGQDALLWELVVRSPTATGNVFVDREFVAGTIGFESGASVSTGCLATGHQAPFEHDFAIYDYGPSHATYGIRFEFAGREGPANAQVVVNLGLSDLAFPLPGLCAEVRAAPDFTIPLGALNSTGVMPLQYLNLGYDPSLVGLQLHTQFIAVDAMQAGLPVVVSNGRMARIPAFPEPIRCAYLYGNYNATTSTVWTSRGVVCGLER